MAKKTPDEGGCTHLVVTTAGGPRTGRTRHLLPGDPGFGRVRRPPLPERVGALAGAVLGEAEGDLVYAVVESVRRKQLPASIAHELLRRALPERPPADVGTLPPAIRNAADWAAAVAELYRLRRDGRLTDDEWRKLLDGVRATWEALREARAQVGVGWG